ncbi:MAG: PLP-dependent aminotransferase family protein [Actinomycetota bacterium]|nr:PLP-dependent aminotransferase family protein [Actinomycetota bacterium]
MANDSAGRHARDSPDLLVTLQPGSGRPLREQLADALKYAVRTGRLRAGAQLPSTRALAADLGVSRGVVVDAYAQLAAEGFFTSFPGSGTHVAATFQLPRVEPVAQQTPIPAPAAAVEFDLRADRPDLALFPRRKWVAATRDAVRELADGDLGYGDPLGSSGLRVDLASYLARVRGAVAAPDGLLVVAGVTQGLVLLARELAAQGHDALAVEDPGSRRLQQVLDHTGLRLVPVPVDRDGLDVSALAATNARAVLCTPAHQFPTGAVLSPYRRSALVRWAMERDNLIIEDDHDAVFRWDRMPMGCLQGLDPQRVALLGSVSRSLAPGLRLGWVVPPAPLLAPLAAAKRDADGGSPVIEQHALARLIEMGAFDRHLRRARKVYRARRDALLAALEQHLSGWTVTGAAAGLHVWLQPAGEVDAAALVAAAAARGVAIEATAATYGQPAPLTGLVLGYARLDNAYATEAVARLADAAHEVGVPA